MVKINKLSPAGVTMRFLYKHIFNFDKYLKKILKYYKVKSIVFEIEFFYFLYQRCKNKIFNKESHKMFQKCSYKVKSVTKTNI